MQAVTWTEKQLQTFNAAVLREANKPAVVWKAKHTMGISKVHLVMIKVLRIKKNKDAAVLNYVGKVSEPDDDNRAALSLCLHEWTNKTSLLCCIQ